MFFKLYYGQQNWSLSSIKLTINKAEMIIFILYTDLAVQRSAWCHRHSIFTPSLDANRKPRSSFDKHLRISRFKCPQINPRSMHYGTTYDISIDCKIPCHGLCDAVYRRRPTGPVTAPSTRGTKFVRGSIQNLASMRIVWLSHGFLHWLLLSAYE